MSSSFSTSLLHWLCQKSTMVQIWPHRCWAEGNKIFLPSAGHFEPVGIARHAFCLICDESALLAHTQLGIHDKLGFSRLLLCLAVPSWLWCLVSLFAGCNSSHGLSGLKTSHSVCQLFPQLRITCKFAEGVLVMGEYESTGTSLRCVYSSVCGSLLVHVSVSQFTSGVSDLPSKVLGWFFPGADHSS